ncbi:MAG TPA: 16S rRNA (guanine(527)-N(7))-methyltransferase RsmG [Stellaceae bacterium]|nr:16S rRNA (guanine(527)-N(7))-methyltransferase RsmG [Stellaceae bacterium]
MMAPITANVRPVRLPLGPTGFARVSGVSRETLDKLTSYVELLSQWNRRINLVSANTLGDVWRRHVLDCAQLAKHLPRQTRVAVDLGAGAGLPGLILAAMGVPEMHLVESDLRKSAFLREAARIMDVAVTLHPERIEKVAAFPADAVVARACASLDQLIDYSEKFVSPKTVFLFLKGETAGAELAAARAAWSLTAETIPSLSDPSGVILKLSAISRAAS